LFTIRILVIENLITIKLEIQIDINS
jgi:hypothetical protein